MGSGSWLGAVLAAALVLWIFSTMPAGRRLVRRLGIRRSAPGAAPRSDHDYLLRVCGGDPAAVERRLEAERARFSQLSEAEIYRRAIRTYMNVRTSDGGDDVEDGREASRRGEPR